MPDYHHSILKSIVLYSTLFKNHTIDSIYFGGGTPSVYFEGGIGSIIGTVRENFRVAPDCEITAEGNPESLTAEKLREWAAAGINRISIGLQSAENTLLKAIGRRHSAEDFFRAYDGAAAAGFQNISADIMLALPGQTITDVKNTLKVLYKLPFLRHLSAYALKLENGTPLYSEYNDIKGENSGAGQLGTEMLPDDDKAADMYDVCYSLLKERGFKRYEVSNFALPGFECRHNLKYWNLGEYLGIGVSAHSYYGGKRYAYSDRTDDFIRGEKPVCTEISGDGRKTEYVMLKLRLEEGIRLCEYKEKFGEALEESGGAEYLLKYGIIGISDGRLFILPDKFYVMNSVVLKLLG